MIIYSTDVCIFPTKAVSEELFWALVNNVKTVFLQNYKHKKCGDLTRIKCGQNMCACINSNIY